VTVAAPDGFVWCGRKKDLALYLTHVNVDGTYDSDEPALYIRNEHRRIESMDPITGLVGTGCPAFIVLFADFWKFRPEDRDRGRFTRIEEMTQSLANGSIALFGIDAPEYRFRIHDAILEFADDVKNLRPPPEMTIEQWAAQMRAAGITFKMNGREIA
jgi:hypothetical protein